MIEASESSHVVINNVTQRCVYIEVAVMDYFTSKLRFERSRWSIVCQDDFLTVFRSQLLLRFTISIVNRQFVEVSTKDVPECRLLTSSSWSWNHWYTGVWVNWGTVQLAVHPARLLGRLDELNLGPSSGFCLPWDVKVNCSSSRWPFTQPRLYKVQRRFTNNRPYSIAVSVSQWFNGWRSLWLLTGLFFCFPP